MAKRCLRSQEGIKGKKGKTGQETISYRMKCAKTANGLSHFVMYGDVPKGKGLL